MDTVSAKFLTLEQNPLKFLKGKQWQFFTLAIIETYVIYKLNPSVLMAGKIYQGSTEEDALINANHLGINLWKKHLIKINKLSLKY